nr:acyl-coenzyme A oxidase-like protein [Macaca fascicularis]
MGAPPPAFAGLGGREEEQRPPETAGEEEQRPPEAAGEEEQRPPEAAGEEEQRPPEAAGEEEQRPPEAAGEEEQRPPEAAGEEEQRPPEAAGEEEQRPPEAAGEEDGCVLLWCFSPVGYDLSLDEMRALTVQRVRFAMGLPLLKCAVQDLAQKTKNFVSRSLVLGEVVSMADMATGVKCGIVYWLFGGAIRNVGSPEHVTKWFQPLQKQKYTGMFAVTERGHRSNVRGIQTEATVDLSAQEFVIDTPCENAEKMYIGNAMYRNYAAVFAQLIVDGRSQGPHCFIVLVRDENGSLYPGVTAIDRRMYKEGLHGVDNGMVIFDKVRIPRENPLDKFGSVAPDRQYHSPTRNKSARFSAMLAALTPSRLAVAFQAMGAMKLPASCLRAVSLVTSALKGQVESRINTPFHLTFKLEEELTAEFHQGYMMENRISGLKCDTDVFATFEGDTVVMLQVVGQELLAQYTKQYEEKPLFGLLQNWAESVGDKLRTRYVLLRPSSSSVFSGLS